MASRWPVRTPCNNVEALAAMRTDEGYMAEVQAQADGSFLLLEKHCPICAAAVACTGLCGKKLGLSSGPGPECGD